MDPLSILDKIGNIKSQTYLKLSTTVWPLMRCNSPWENMDDDHELLYNEALIRYAEKIVDNRAEMQTELNQWSPLTGNYVNSKSTYLKICYKPQDNNGIYSLCFNHDGTTLIVGYENGYVEAVDMIKEIPVVVKPSEGRNVAVSSIKYHPFNANHFYFSCTNGHIYKCESDDDNYEIRRIVSEGKNETYAMDLNMSGEKMITGGKDSRIRVYDLETNDVCMCYKGFALECKDSYMRLLEEGEEEGHYLNIYSIVCHPENPSIFASAGLDSNIKIWDLRMKQFPVKNIFGPHILGDSIDLLGNKVLSGQWTTSEALQIWDASSCRLIHTFSPTNISPQSFGQYIYCAKFIKGFNGLWSEDIVLAGGSGLGGLLVVSLSEDLVLAQFKDEGSILAVDNHNDIVAYGGTNHTLYISQFFPNDPEE